MLICSHRGSRWCDAKQRDRAAKMAKRLRIELQLEPFVVGSPRLQSTR